jgi:hypothetical protein
MRDHDCGCPISRVLCEKPALSDAEGLKSVKHAAKALLRVLSGSS